jgi:xanthine/CO dehydrogenase XdhC/CoxF family maturation factor
MLIPLYGSAVGTISGGCLEQDLIKKAWWLTDSGEAVVRRYSTADHENDDLDDGDAALTFGLGCNGTVHVLLERLCPNKNSILTNVLQRVKTTGEPAALATVIAAGPGSVVSVGARMGRTAYINFYEGVPSEALSNFIATSLRRTLETKKSSLMLYGQGDSEIEIFFEYIPPQRRLVIFGAGHDAVPLIQCAKALNWHTTVIDGRANFARPERFPVADSVIVAAIDAPFELKEIVDNAAVVIMTHSYRQDKYWLSSVLGCSPAYIGQLGPRDRTERLLEELCVPEEVFKTREEFHFPVGLDLGGDSPASVALAVVGEIIAYLNKRQGGMLRYRKSKIHETCQPIRSTEDVVQRVS